MEKEMNGLFSNNKFDLNLFNSNEKKSYLKNFPIIKI